MQTRTYLLDITTNRRGEIVDLVVNEASASANDIAEPTAEEVLEAIEEGRAFDVEDAEIFKDGYMGNLLKQSDHYPGAVILFDSEYDFKEVSVYNRKGKLIERLSYHGRSNPDSDGVGRQTWRFQRPMNQLPKRVFIKADDMLFLVKGVKSGRVD